MELKNKLKNQAKSGDNVMNGQESNCDNGTNTIVFQGHPTGEWQVDGASWTASPAQWWLACWGIRSTVTTEMLLMCK